MKKYLGFLSVLLLAFSLATIANAETSAGGSVSGDASVQVKTPRLDGGPTRDGKPRPPMGAGVDGKAKIESEQYVGADGQEDGDMHDNIDSIREAAKAKMQALREQIKNEKDSAKAKIKDLRLTGREQALSRFDAAVTRISALKDKISTQITYLSGKGVDVSAAANFMATAQVKIDAAKTVVADINALLAKSADQLSAADKATLKAKSDEVQADLKAANESLKSATKSLRDAVKAKIGELKGTGAPSAGANGSLNGQVETQTQGQ